MKLVQQIDNPGEGFGIKIVRLVSRAVAAHEIGQELTLVPQIAERVPQRGADVRAKPLIVGDRQIVV